MIRTSRTAQIARAVHALGGEATKAQFIAAREAVALSARGANGAGFGTRHPYFVAQAGIVRLTEDGRRRIAR